MVEALSGPQQVLRVIRFGDTYYNTITDQEINFKSIFIWWYLSTSRQTAINSLTQNCRVILTKLLLCFDHHTDWMSQSCWWIIYENYSVSTLICMSSRTLSAVWHRQFWADDVILHVIRVDAFHYCVVRTNREPPIYPILALMSTRPFSPYY